MESHILDKQIKIYVADNTDFCSEVVTYFDTKEKYKIVGYCDDGAKAVEEIVSLEPDIVLLECILPSLDGFAIMDKLSAKMGEKKPSVIVVSALSHQGFVSKAMEQGAAYFLCKPTTPNAIEQRIVDVVA
ncbi:MAG: response regulator, partial [Clostridia bacterium]|nr:response regulator [Clostridia bacterium]